MKKILKDYLSIILLVFILILALIFRLWNVSSNPAGFFCDEASIGYNAYTILTTGTDEYEISSPLFFRAFGEYKSPIQIYSTVPSIALFGLNEFSTRFVSVLYGALSILSTYLLATVLFHKKRYKQIAALTVALLLAISPWHIHLSRVAFEHMPFVFFTTLGLYAFLKSQEKPKILIVSVLLFVAAIYSYFPARIFIPLFGFGLAVIHYKFFIAHKKISAFATFLLLILILPLVFHLTQEGVSRWNQVSIFNNPPGDQSIIMYIANNYLSHFSYDFLFKKGDIDMPGQFITRHSVRGIGELYLFQLPLVLLGILFLFRNHKKAFTYLTLWLLVYPTGSMFTSDQSAQATRSIIGVIPFQIISAAGILGIIRYFKNYPLIRAVILIAFCIFACFSILQFSQKYFHEYPKYSADFWGWQYGPKEIVSYFSKNQNFYDETIMEGSFNAPDIFFKFYAPKSCHKCRLGLPHLDYNSDIRQLFAVTPYYLQEYPEFAFKVHKTIYYPNGNIAFVIGEIVQ